MLDIAEDAMADRTAVAVSQLSDSESEPAAAGGEVAPKSRPARKTKVAAEGGRAAKKPKISDLPGLGRSTGQSFFALPPSVNAIEICSGQGNLTRALNDWGFNAVGVDMCLDINHDLLNESFLVSIKNRIASGSVCYVHIAPPCNTYSIARHPKIRCELLSNSTDLSCYKQLNL